MQYLRRHRQQLGGYLPRRETVCDALPSARHRKLRAVRAAGRWQEMSTTMAFVRMLGTLLKDASSGPRIVPIVADEARTFGMANLFKQVGIYSSVGPALRARRHRLGAELPRGAGWADPGRRHQRGGRDCELDGSRHQLQSVHGLAMLPFYIYYSCSASSAWATPSGRLPTSARAGFLLGATSGRTTLGGEGLQHQDGTSHLVAATIPNCKAYDPAYAGEMAVIIDAQACARW